MSATRAQLRDALETVRPVWRPSLPLAGMWLFMAVISLYPFWDELKFMWGWWMDRPEFSHGILMPVISIFLFWKNSDKFEKFPFVNNVWGVLLTLFGAFLFLIGKLGSVIVLVQYAYVITLGGVALSLVSWQGATSLWMPFVILVLMIPVPEFVLKNMTVDLQLISSKLAVFMMRLAGVTVFLEGNIIDLGTAKLQVAEACSGLRYLFPLMTLGFIIACFYRAAMWKRVVVFLSSAPLTIFMNSFRIAFVGITVDHWGESVAGGFLHDFEGWLIFMASTLLMVGEMMILNRVGASRRPLRETFGIEFPKKAPAVAPRRSWQPTTTFLISCSIVLLMCVYSFTAPEVIENVPARQSFAEFPEQIGEWTGTRAGMEAVFLDELKLDDYVIANYTRPGSLPVNFYVAWYNSQRGGQSSHSPRTCLPGGGWRIASLDRIKVPGVFISGQPLFVNRGLVENGDQRQLVYYWFQQRGRIITNEYVVKWYLFWDSLTRHRTDGAMVRAIVSVPQGTAVASAEAQLADFVRDAAPRLSPYIPD
ncbi:MAG TPA: VPLPA-CTERM-specific exosortase XrtD [Steroidobacteraceae bacterium]|nr:VPLPA-CTERM-specific exosortase XrtD [Steroidobacteraceae bacterium]